MLTDRLLPALCITLALASGCENPVTPSAIAAPGIASFDRDRDERLPSYVIEDLGIPAGMLSSVATNINDDGNVIGEFRGPTPAPGSFRIRRAFLYTTTMKDLGLLPGTIQSRAFGLNNEREVVGTTLSTPVDGFGRLQAFLWTPKRGMEALPSLPGGELYTIAQSINDDGDIVGCMYLDDNFSPQHLVRWRGKHHAIEDLGTGPDDGGACGAAVNQKGEIAVLVHTDLGDLHAATYDGAFHLLGEPAGTVNSAVASINQRGSVVGVGFNNFSVDPTVAFLWTRKDGMQVIPLLPGDASSGVAGINEHSLVVGGGLTTRASTCQHPWVWSPEWATPSLLPTLTGLHPEANCPNGLLTLTANVNEKGEIAGQSAAADGSLRAVRWKTIKRGSNR
jgi:uncharacterized membrane protein